MPKNGTRISSGISNVNGRKLRYRALLEDLSILGDNLDDNDACMEKTTSVVREAQVLLAQGDIEERVRHPGEGYLDSQVLLATSQLALRCVQAISGNVNHYDKHALAQHIRENQSFWEFTFPREVPPTAQLHGAGAGAGAAGEARARAPRRRLERQNLNAELKAPENVDRMEKSEEGSEMVSRVNRFINKTYRARGGRALSYFHIVLDPDSFARTIENIYYLSFLVRDGHVSIQLDEDVGLPMVRPVVAAAADGATELAENQFIVSLNMKRWREMIESFDIKKPMMVIKRI